MVEAKGKELAILPFIKTQQTSKSVTIKNVLV
jgi:hypothetical protein